MDTILSPSRRPVDQDILKGRLLGLLPVIVGVLREGVDVALRGFLIITPISDVSKPLALERPALKRNAAKEMAQGSIRGPEPPIPEDGYAQRDVLPLQRKVHPPEIVKDGFDRDGCRIDL